MAPELKGIFAPGQEEQRLNEYAADMWSLGEVAFQALTGKSCFANINELYCYMHNKQTFPVSVLNSSKVTSEGQHFIKLLMLPAPERRLPARQALDHTWLKSQKPEYARKPFVVPIM